MTRKNALIIMALLFLLTGLVSGIFVWVPGVQAFIPAASSQTPQVSLSAPMASTKESEEVAPPVPETVEIPESTVVPEPTVVPDPPVSTEIPKEEPTTQYTYTAIQKKQQLFIRDGASLDANVIGYLMPGDSGEVISIGESWVLLRHGDIEGYSYKKYLQLNEVPQSSNP